MANKSTKQNTSAGTKLYIQDDTMRAQVLSFESITGLGGITYGTEATNDVTTGVTESKKTNLQEQTGTITIKDNLDAENAGLDMLIAYAKEEGDKERVILIVEGNDSAKTKRAFDVIVTDYQPGDISSTALRKPVFTVMGNEMEEVPEPPAGS